MDDTRPGPLGTPLGQFGLGALALVIGAALLFTLIGAVSGDEGNGGDQVVATPPATATGDPTADGGSPTGPQTDATDVPVAPTEATTDPTTPATEAETASEVDPGSISIQVLGGSDQASDDEAVLACLRDAGYDSLITGNRAISTYPTTVVYYSPGEDNQAAAEQVARALGVSAAEEKPDNLSETVPVHVISGQDGTDLC